MDQRTLPFLLLGCFVGMLHVEATVPSCTAPSLDNGYFYSQPNGQKLTYACDDGYKPAVEEGWWATITCNEGQWSDTPQCIDAKACIQPSIHNADCTSESSNGFYKEQSVIEFKCKEGYEHKGPVTRATCVDGSWSSMPVCGKSASACNEPAKIPHAVVLQKPQQEVYAANTMVHYGCEEGYTTGQSPNLVTCENGIWSASRPCGITPPPPSGGSTSDGSVTPSSNGGVDRCGPKPIVLNGEYLRSGSDYLKYECVLYYNLEGSDTVRCLSNGSWTKPPVCRAAYCYVDTEEYPILENAGQIFMKEGNKMRLTCVERYYGRNQYSEFQCMKNGIVEHTVCCTSLKFASWLECEKFQ